ncbi:MAG: adenosine kinase [Spirochaetia bacterium]|nr:adenosine kinase [Spirochaetia bacterium]
MKSKILHVYGVGNPLIDIITNIEEKKLERLGIHKGAMHLIDIERRRDLLKIIETMDVEYSCGGSCPNTILTLAALGVETTLAGKVGNDEFGEIYKKQVKEHHIQDEIVVCDEATGSSIIFITEDSERTMNTFLGANRFYHKENIVKESIIAADFFHFTGYMYDTPSQKEAIHIALDIAKTHNTTITFDIADVFAVGRNREGFLKLISEYADVVFANGEEARIIFDHYDPYECCKSMGKLCTTAIVKNGKLGSFISHDQKMYNIPVQGPSTPLDTTGAGDIYAAGFLYGLCHHLDIEQSGYIASYLAGEIVQQRGAQFNKEKALSIKHMLDSKFNLS